MDSIPNKIKEPFNSSKDLYNWKKEGVALSMEKNPDPENTRVV